MKIAEVEIRALSLLMKASSKKFVLELCRDVEKNICNPIPVSLNKKIMSNLSVTESEAIQLSKSLEGLIRKILFENLSTFEDIADVFPESFHNNLKDLLIKILVECSYEWKTEFLNMTVSLPCLTEFNYRVDWKMSGDNSEKFTTPTCILDLNIAHSSLESPELVSVELTRENLETMLHGLGRIRDQLSAVAKK